MISTMADLQQLANRKRRDRLVPAEQPTRVVGHDPRAPAVRGGILTEPRRGEPPGMACKGPGV